MDIDGETTEGGQENFSHLDHGRVRYRGDKKPQKIKKKIASSFQKSDETEKGCLGNTGWD